MPLRDWLPRHIYYGHAGKEIAAEVASKTGFDKDPEVQAYLNLITDTIPPDYKMAMKRRQYQPVGGTYKRAKMSAAYARVGRMPWGKMAASRKRTPRFVRRPLRARKRTYKRYVRKPTVMSMAESKHVFTPAMGTAGVIQNNVETITPIVMPLVSATYSKDTFQGRRLYVTGIKLYMSFVNPNTVKDKMVIMVVCELPANESISDTEIWRGQTGELDENLHSLPFAMRSRARISSHSDHKIIYRRAFKLGANTLTDGTDHFKHFKKWIPINQQLNLDRGEDSGADILNKRWQVRFYQTNLDNSAAPDGLNAVQVLGSSATLYFKDL